MAVCCVERYRTQPCLPAIGRTLPPVRCQCVGRQTNPMAYNVSPATMPFKPAPLSYRSIEATKGEGTLRASRRPNTGRVRQCRSMPGCDTLGRSFCAPTRSSTEASVALDRATQYAPAPAIDGEARGVLGPPAFVFAGDDGSCRPAACGANLVNLTLTAQMTASAAPKRAGGMDAAKPLLQNKHGNACARKRDRTVPPDRTPGKVKDETSVEPRVLRLLE